MKKKEINMGCHPHSYLCDTFTDTSPSTSFPPIIYSQPHSLISFLVLLLSLILLFIKLIQFSKLSENYTLISWFSSHPQYLYKFACCGA